MVVMPFYWPIVESAKVLVHLLWGFWQPEIQMFWRLQERQKGYVEKGSRTQKGQCHSAYTILDNQLDNKETYDFSGIGFRWSLLKWTNLGERILTNCLLYYIYFAIKGRFLLLTVARALKDHPKEVLLILNWIKFYLLWHKVLFYLASPLSFLPGRTGVTGVFTWAGCKSPPPAASAEYLMFVYSLPAFWLLCYWNGKTCMFAIYAKCTVKERWSNKKENKHLSRGRLCNQLANLFSFHSLG